MRPNSRTLQESVVALRYLRLLGPLAWDRFPERDLQRNCDKPAVPYAPFGRLLGQAGSRADLYGAVAS